MKAETNETKPHESNEFSYTQRIQEFIWQRKRALADSLTRQSERITVRNKKLTMIAIGLVIGGACTYLTISPFVSTNKLEPQVPATEGTPTILTPAPGPVLTPEDYHMLRGFIKTADSLKYYDPMSYNEALRGREGLVDSIRLLLTIKP